MLDLLADVLLIECYFGQVQHIEVHVLSIIDAGNELEKFRLNITTFLEGILLHKELHSLLAVIVVLLDEFVLAFAPYCGVMFRQELHEFDSVEDHFVAEKKLHLWLLQITTHIKGKTGIANIVERLAQPHHHLNLQFFQLISFGFQPNSFGGVLLNINIHPLQQRQVVLVDVNFWIVLTEVGYLL